MRHNNFISIIARNEEYFAFRDGVQLYFVEEDPRRKNRRYLKFDYVELMEGEAISSYDSDNDPIVRISQDAVQTLFNQLWIMGYRPKDGTGNSGHMEALNRHLEDMRVIVASKLGVELKK